jgi:hypothetical protein
MGILMRHGFRCAAALWFGVSCVSAVFGETSREYDLKAVFLYNFATFVEWPPEAFASSDSPIVIGVYGQDPFGRVLDDVVSGERVRDHPLVVKRYWRLEDVKNCHLLFICPSESWHFPEILATLRGHPVLTVADAPRFVESGGMIGFSMNAGHLQLAINPSAARAVEITVSSKLLQLAHVVDHEGPRP